MQGAAVVGRGQGLGRLAVGHCCLLSLHKEFVHR